MIKVQKKTMPWGGIIAIRATTQEDYIIAQAGVAGLEIGTETDLSRGVMSPGSGAGAPRTGSSIRAVCAHCGHQEEMVGDFENYLKPAYIGTGKQFNHDCAGCRRQPAYYTVVDTSKG